MKTTVQKWGNSLAVRIPRPFAEEVHLEENTARRKSPRRDPDVKAVLQRATLLLATA
ncbi:MAG TPA: AbrB/MazE/SpoVT family DNA-binding domain-containing protein [Thermoanaerobaculia bacterium]|nr:AbrB/MazE/SpoVT family DNA-binding domain-containing protein [Thermoanaerobaculia bacterium]